MRFSLAAAAAALAGTAQAHINGISVPSTIKPGDTFNLIVESSDWIQSSYDVAIVFGYTYGKQFANAINNPIGQLNLGPKLSNQLHSFNKTLTIPKNVPKGPGVISASLLTLVGAYDFPSLENYNVSITFGSSTSKKYKSSDA